MAFIPDNAIEVFGTLHLEAVQKLYRKTHKNPVRVIEPKQWKWIPAFAGMRGKRQELRGYKAVYGME